LKNIASNSVPQSPKIIFSACQMAKIKKFRTLEEGILLLQQEAKSKPLSIAEILRILSGKGRSLILILLSLPFCQPIQIPGFSVPFGLGIAFIGLRMAFGKRAWLPRRILETRVPPQTFEKIADNTIYVARKLKPWIHPRFTGLCHSSFMEKANGLIIFILGLFLALPLPIPLSNLVAAWSIFLISLGTLEDDGVLVLIGYLVCVLAIVALVAMALTIRGLVWNFV